MNHHEPSFYNHHQPSFAPVVTLGDSRGRLSQGNEGAKGYGYDWMCSWGDVVLMPVTWIWDSWETMEKNLKNRWVVTPI